MDTLLIERALWRLRVVLVELLEGWSSPDRFRAAVQDVHEVLIHAMAACGPDGGDTVQRELLLAVVDAFSSDPPRATKDEIADLIKRLGVACHRDGPLPEANALPMAPRASSAKARMVTPEKTDAITAVDVFFATDRKASGKSAPDDVFGGTRSEGGGAGALSYGHCTVTIPPGHRQGEIETPSFWRLEFRSNPKKHVVLKDVTIQTVDDFFQAIRERTADPAQADAFIFVHGYNVSFADAARRTGQMAYDLGFAGVPVFYSWPSAACAKDYVRDGNAIEWSTPHLVLFLKDFLARSQAKNIYLIAHSMGNRALTAAVVDVFRTDPTAQERLREIILTAPDVDARVFLENIAPHMTAARTSPVTLYVSSRDLALETSKLLNGGTRLGDSTPAPVICAGVETVDASMVDTSFMGHSYFAGARSVIADIVSVFKGTRAAKRFGLRPTSDAQGRTYWEFVP